ncbi:hypothetical protein WDU94_012702, partial [Cyamophila willieti]
CLSTLLGQREILALLTKLKTDKSPLYDPFLRSMPDDIVTMHRDENWIETVGKHVDYGLNLNEIRGAIPRVDLRTDVHTEPSETFTREYNTEPSETFSREYRGDTRLNIEIRTPRDHFETEANVWKDQDGPRKCPGDPRGNVSRKFPDDPRGNVSRKFPDDPRGNISRETTVNVSRDHLEIRPDVSRDHVEPPRANVSRKFPDDPRGNVSRETTVNVSRDHLEIRPNVSRDHVEPPRANVARQSKELVDPGAKVFHSTSRTSISPSVENQNSSVTDSLFEPANSSCLSNSNRTVILSETSPSQSDAHQNIIKNKEPRSILKKPTPVIANSSGPFGKTSPVFGNTLSGPELGSSDSRPVFGNSFSLPPVFGNSSEANGSVCDQSSQPNTCAFASPVFGNTSSASELGSSVSKPVFGNPTSLPSIFGNSSEANGSVCGQSSQPNTFAFGRSSSVFKQQIQNTNNDNDLEIIETKSTINKEVFGKTSPVFDNTSSASELGSSVSKQVFGNPTSLPSVFGNSSEATATVSGQSSQFNTFAFGKSFSGPITSLFGTLTANQNDTRSLSDEQRNSESSSTVGLFGKSTTVFGQLSTPTGQLSGHNNPWVSPTHNAKRSVVMSSIPGPFGRGSITESVFNDPMETLSNDSDVEIIEPNPTDVNPTPVIEIVSDDSSEDSESNNIDESVEYNNVSRHIDESSSSHLKQHTGNMGNSSTDGRITSPYQTGNMGNSSTDGRITSPYQTGSLDNDSAINTKNSLPYRSDTKVESNSRITWQNSVDNPAINNDRIATPCSNNQSGSKRRISFHAELEKVRVFDTESTTSHDSVWTSDKRTRIYEGDRAHVDPSFGTNYENIRNTARPPYQNDRNLPVNVNTRNSKSQHHFEVPAHSNYRDSVSQNDNVVAAKLVLQLDTVYGNRTVSEKLIFIHDFFYKCPVVRNQFELILELCEKKSSDRALWALFEIVLNKAIDCESKRHTNEIMKDTLEKHLRRILAKYGIDELIKTPVICKDNWSPLRIWCFVSQYQDINDAIKVLEKYFLLEEDPSDWDLAYKESDLKPFCLVVTELLYAYSSDEHADRFLTVHLCRLLLSLYKNSPQNSSPDFPRVLERSVLKLLDFYLFAFFKSQKSKPVHVSNDLDYDSEREMTRDNDDSDESEERDFYKKEFLDLGFKLLPLMNNLLDVVPNLCSSSPSKTLTRACVMYFVHSCPSSDPNLEQVIMLMKTIPHIYTFHEEGSVIVLKDIYSEEEMIVLLSHAFHIIASSVSLVQSIKQNKTTVMIHLEKSSKSIHGCSLVRDLKQDLPNHLKMHNRNPNMRLKKVLKSRLLGKMATLELNDEQPVGSNNWFHLDNLSVIAHIHAIQNKELGGQIPQGM